MRLREHLAVTWSAGSGTVYLPEVLGPSKPWAKSLEALYNDNASSVVILAGHAVAALMHHDERCAIVVKRAME